MIIFIITFATVSSIVFSLYFYHLKNINQRDEIRRLQHLVEYKSHAYYSLSQQYQDTKEYLSNLQRQEA